MKKFVKYAIVFLALGLCCGIFYREFTKAYEATGQFTILGLCHPHFLALGVLLTLVIGLVGERLGTNDKKLFKIGFRTYSIGVLLTGIMLLVRGILDVLEKSPTIEFAVSSGANGAISGVAGLCHAALGVGIVIVFVSWLIKDKKQKPEPNDVGASSGKAE